MVKLKYVGKTEQLVRLERSGEKTLIKPGQTIVVNEMIARDLLRAYSRLFRDLSQKGKVEGGLEKGRVETAVPNGANKPEANQDSGQTDEQEEKEEGGESGEKPKTTIVTQELLDKHPELIEQGAKVGDEIELEEEQAEETKGKAQPKKTEKKAKK